MAATGLSGNRPQQALRFLIMNVAICAIGEKVVTLHFGGALALMTATNGPRQAHRIGKVGILSERAIVPSGAKRQASAWTAIWRLSFTLGATFPAGCLGDVVYSSHRFLELRITDPRSGNVIPGCTVEALAKYNDRWRYYDTQRLRLMGEDRDDAWFSRMMPARHKADRNGYVRYVENRSSMQRPSQLDRLRNITYLIRIRNDTASEILQLPMEPGSTAKKDEFKVTVLSVSKSRKGDADAK